MVFQGNYLYFVSVLGQGCFWLLFPVYLPSFVLNKILNRNIAHISKFFEPEFLDQIIVNFFFLTEYVFPFVFSFFQTGG